MQKTHSGPHWPRSSVISHSSKYNAATSASFWGSGSHITRAQVECWLQAQNAYMLHRKIIRKFNRRKFLEKGLHHMWQADLVVLCQRGPRQSGSDLHCIGATLMLTACQSLILFCALTLKFYLQNSRVRIRAPGATV